MWEWVTATGRVISAVATTAERAWQVAVLVFGLTAAGVMAWLATTWDWYWATFNWAGAAIAFLVSFLGLAMGIFLLSVAATLYARRNQPVSALIPAPEGPLVWFGNITMGGGMIGPVRTLEFLGFNSSQKEVRLQEANITSAINGVRLPLKVLAANAHAGNEWVSVDEINLVPPGARIQVLAEFNPPNGLEPIIFLETWRQFFLNAADDVRTYRRPFNEGELMPFFPGKVGPRITKKTA